ncbi:MAG: single-stranded DNA-binding protein [Armatimonadaceae bacterium]
MNRVILIGRLTADPEVRYTPNGVPVASMRIAVDRPQSSESRAQGQDKQTDFIDLTAWRQSAEFAGKYLGKGRLIAVEGKLQIEEYQAQDGTRRKAAKVVCDSIRPLDRARDSNDSGDGGYSQERQPSSGYSQRPPVNMPTSSGFDEDDISDPFAE